MKSILALAALAFATPAAAQTTNANFVGPRVEATAGFDDRNDTVNYGAGAGYDLGLGDRFTLGVEANADNFASYRDYGAAARLGYAATDNLLLFGTAGYANLKGRDGLRVGGGVEFSTGTPVYGKVEYRYTDFDHGDERHSGLVGFGLRF